jgi:hypothetical protein
MSETSRRLVEVGTMLQKARPAPVPTKEQRASRSLPAELKVRSGSTKCP